jgi:hypothetical protein
MLGFVQLFQPLRRPLAANTLDVLLKTYELAPQVPQVVIETAAALARADRLPEAARVLAPLAYAPHQSSAAQRAAALLTHAEAGDKAGFLAQLAGAPSPPVAKPADATVDDAGDDDPPD